jgi:hypothetical protein
MSFKINFKTQKEEQKSGAYLKNIGNVQVITNFFARMGFRIQFQRRQHGCELSRTLQCPNP